MPHAHKYTQTNMQQAAYNIHATATADGAAITMMEHGAWSMFVSDYVCVWNIEIERTGKSASRQHNHHRSPSLVHIRMAPFRHQTYHTIISGHATIPRLGCGSAPPNDVWRSVATDRAQWQCVCLCVLVPLAFLVSMYRMLVSVSGCLPVYALRKTSTKALLAMKKKKKIVLTCWGQFFSSENFSHSFRKKQ